VAGASFPETREPRQKAWADVRFLFMNRMNFGNVFPDLSVGRQLIIPQAIARTERQAKFIRPSSYPDPPAPTIHQGQQVAL